MLIMTVTFVPEPNKYKDLKALYQMCTTYGQISCRIGTGSKQFQRPKSAPPMYHFLVLVVPTLHNANTTSQNPCYKSAKDYGTGLQKSPWQIGYTTTEGSDGHTDTPTDN